MRARIPVTIITGFLGSGKTTLLNRLLRQPELADTAVIVNEFGEVGLDHELVEASDGTVVLLANGCVCCAVRGDFVRALDELHRRRAQASGWRFVRIVVETSGLADPGPIIQALLSDPSLCARYELDGVITTVDVLSVAATMQAHFEAVRQIAVADQIVLTKHDLLHAETAAASLDALRASLLRLNPGVCIATASDVVRHILRSAPLAHGQHPDDHERWLRTDALAIRPLHGADADTTHTARVKSFCIVREEPMSEATLAMFLEGIVKYLGPGLLRIKGIVHVAEQPAQPAVIQGAQSVLHELTWLPHWPSADRRTRLVFITLDVDQEEVEEMFTMIERMQANTVRARTRAANQRQPDSLQMPSPICAS